MASIKRAKLTRADIAHWDGRNATYSRPNAAGGTSVGLAVGNEVDVLQVFGDGTERTRATIAVGINYIGTAACTLVFAPGTWTITQSLTIGSNFVCRLPEGCIFDISTGVTLTFSGPVLAEGVTHTTGAGTTVGLYNGRLSGVHVGRGKNTGNARGTAVGHGSLQSTGVGEDNTAVGYTSLPTCSGIKNTAVGSRAMFSSTTPYQCTAVGNEALYALTSGSYHTAVGESALIAMTNASSCVAIGQTSQFSNATGNENTSVGTQSLYTATAPTECVAIGMKAMYSPGNVSYCTAVGTRAMQNITSGDNNTAIGYAALNGAASSQGANNTAVGYNALTAVTNGSSNTAVGKDALLSLTTGQTNTVVGRVAGDAITTGQENTAVGDNALGGLSTGSGNTGIGKNANATTTGSNNTAVGNSSLQNATNETNSTGVGYQAEVTGSNQVQLGNSSTTTYAYGAVQDRSDARDKTEVRDTILGLDFINALHPVDFRWAYREDEGRVRSRFHHGLIAQEVKAACESVGVDFGGYQDHSINGGKDVLTIGYAELIGPLIRAVQELTARVKELEGA